MPKLLLIGWDSADWKMIHPLSQAGGMPMFTRMVESGVSGNLQTLQPVLSPMLWTSIATGKRAFDHGVHGFTEIDPLTGQVRPSSVASRKCASLWNILAARGLSCHAIGWFATHGEEIPGGSVISNLFPAPTAAPGQDWPPTPPGTISPEDRAAIMNDLRVSPEDIDAEIVSLFCPKFQEIDTTTDPHINQLRIHLAELFSIHSAACWTVENTEWDFVAVYLRAMDEIAHHFMHFHPPRMEGVPEREFKWYGDVMNGTYRLHDMLLSRLIALAPEDTHVMVVSDHGFHSDHLRPKFTPQVSAGITVWHRDQGVIAAAGPKFKKDALIHGAGLLDVAPTILHLFDIPAGSDMEGRVLIDAFADTTPPPARIPSHDSPSTLPRRSGNTLTHGESEALMEQFAAMGYIKKLSGNQSEDAEETSRENRWSLARSFVDAARHQDALPVLEDLYFEHPERTDFAQTLAACQGQLGLHDEAHEVIEAALEASANPTTSALLRARFAALRDDHEAALAHLDEAAASASITHDFRYLQQRVLLLVNTRRYDELQPLCEAILAIDSDHPQAWLGLAFCHWKSQRFENALDAVQRALALHFHYPTAHLLRSRIEWKLGHHTASEESLHQALSLAPVFPAALRRMAALCRITGRHEEARQLRTYTAKSHLEIEYRKKQINSTRAAARERARQRIAQRSQNNLARKRATEAGEITIVTGLPRSGTSLLMQMLHRGGFPVLTDGQRVADEHNPEGYLEWELAKDLPTNPHLIAEAAGKAVKIVTPLIPHLPKDYRYRFLFMMRPVEEVAMSQARFAPTDTPHSVLEESLRKHRDQILSTIRTHLGSNLLEIDFPTLVRNPTDGAEKIMSFLGNPAHLDPADMALAIRPELHRCKL